MKKCIVVSDSFKGTLPSSRICALARDVFGRIMPDCELITVPVADGGEGTVDCFVQALGARRVFTSVSGPYGEPVRAGFAVIGETAIIEMASAAGLPLVGDKKDPMRAGTRGVGQLIAHAVSGGCKKILLGLGGSATNDGGCGCAYALGAVFTDINGRSFVPTGGTLRDIEKIDLSGVKKLLGGVEVTVMCDVDNPLYGKNGAAYVFAPQKGADAQGVEILDDNLRHLARKILECTGADVSELPGGGAAGGMGAGCVAVVGGRLCSGIDAILDAVSFDDMLEGAGMVIAGEGKLDSQSLQGKVVSGVARRTGAKGVPLVVLSGVVDDSAADVYCRGVSAVFCTNRAARPVSELHEHCESDYTSALGDILRLVKIVEGIS